MKKYNSLLLVLVLVLPRLTRAMHNERAPMLVHRPLSFYNRMILTGYVLSQVVPVASVSNFDQSNETCDFPIRHICDGSIDWYSGGVGIFFGAFGGICAGALIHKIKNIIKNKIFSGQPA